MSGKGFEGLLAYQKAFAAAMEIFEMTKGFPKEEKYSLIDQIRRSSRSVCANIAEAYRKRAYHKHFFSKLTDADAECSETIVWLDFALSSKYIDNELNSKVKKAYQEIGKLIGYMMQNPEKFK